jgi:hypothetical protein
MSRSGYIDDVDDAWQHVMWRGAVASAIRGKRGQSFLKEMLAAFGAMEQRRLIKDELQDAYDDGAVCAIGAVGKARGVDIGGVDPHDRESVAAVFGISPALAAEVVYLNDEGGPFKETPEARYLRMREWIENQIRRADMKGAP